MTETTTTEGIADELGIVVGDWVTIIRPSHTVAGEVTDITLDGEAVELNGYTGSLFSLEGADVSIA